MDVYTVRMYVSWKAFKIVVQEVGMRRCVSTPKEWSLHGYQMLCYMLFSLSFTFYMTLAISIIHIDEGGLSNKLRMQQIPLKLDRSSQHRGTSLRMHASSPVWQLHWESVIYGVSKHCKSYWSTVHTDYCDILINAWQIIELIGQLPSSS